MMRTTQRRSDEEEEEEGLTLIHFVHKYGLMYEYARVCRQFLEDEGTDTTKWPHSYLIQ